MADSSPRPSSTIHTSVAAPPDSSAVDGPTPPAQTSVEELCLAFYDQSVAYAKTLWRNSASLRDRLDIGDAESAAGFGLLRAAERWDPELGPFKPWMRRHIKYEIQETVRNATMVSRTVMENLKSLRSAELALETRLKRRPELSEIAQFMEISEAEVRELEELRNAAREPKELDIVDQEHISLEADEAPAVAEEMVQAAMASFGPLSGDERVVLALHYMEGISFRDVAKILGKRADAVSRIHGKAKQTAGEFLKNVDPSDLASEGL